MSDPNLDLAWQALAQTIVQRLDNITMGVGASGTWDISILGAAARAAKLTIARNINGIAFDGTQDIEVSSLRATGKTVLSVLANSDAIHGLQVTGAGSGGTVSVESQGTSNLHVRASAALSLQSSGGDVILLASTKRVRFGANPVALSIDHTALTGNRTLTMPDGDVTLMPGTMLTTGGDVSFTGIKTFDQAIRVVDTFDVNGSGSNAQKQGLYAASLGASVGSTENPTNVALLGVKVSNTHNLAITADAAGYIWTYVGGSSAGPYTFKSKAKQADKWSGAMTLNASGDATGTTSFDGSATANMSLTLASIITAGSRLTSATSITPLIFDAKGRLTGIDTPVLITPAFSSITGKPTTLGGYGITDALPTTGDVSHSGKFNFTNTTDATSLVAAAVVLSGGLSVGKKARFGDDVLITGRLTVLAGITSVGVDKEIIVSDPVITLGGDQDLTADDGRDRGVEYRWHDGVGPLRGFFGYSRASDSFKFIPRATNTNEIFTGALGTIEANFKGPLNGNALTSTKLASTFQIASSGDVTWSVTTDGSANVSAVATLANTGVASGSYQSDETVHQITFDSKGRATAVGAAIPMAPRWANIKDKPTSPEDFGITDYVTRTTAQAISGLKTFTNTTEMIALGAAGAIFQGGVSIAKKLLVAGGLAVGSVAQFANAHEVSATQANLSLLSYNTTGLGNGGSELQLVRTRGASATDRTALNTSDEIGGIGWYMAYGTGVQRLTRLTSYVADAATLTTGLRLFVGSGGGVSLQAMQMTSALTTFYQQGSLSHNSRLVTFGSFAIIDSGSSVPTISLFSPGGSNTSPSQTPQAATVGTIQGQGYPTGGGRLAVAAIDFRTAQPITGTAAGGRIVFRTVGNNLLSLVDKLTIDQDGTASFSQNSATAWTAFGSTVKARIQTVGGSTASSSVGLIQMTPDASAPLMMFAKSRGNYSGWVIPQDQDQLGTLVFGGTVTASVMAEGHRYEVYADGSPTTTTVPAGIRLQTVAAGESVMTPRISIRSSKRIGFNQDNPIAAYHFNATHNPSNVHPWRVGMLLESEGASTGGRIGIRVSDTGESPFLIFSRSQGTINAPTAVVNGNALGAVMASGAYDNAGGWAGGGGTPSLAFYAAEDFTSSARGTTVRLANVAKGQTSAADVYIVDENNNHVFGGLALAPVSDVGIGTPKMMVHSSTSFAKRLARSVSVAADVGMTTFAGYDANAAVYRDVAAITGRQDLNALSGGLVFYVRAPGASVLGQGMFLTQQGNLNVSPSSTVGPNDGYGRQLNVSQGQTRTTILQQSVNTDDERLYLLNNASPKSGAFDGSFIYDKTNASATYYLQQTGQHVWGIADPGTKDTAITWRQSMRLTSYGLQVKGNGELLKLETTAARGGGNNYIQFYDVTGVKGYLGYGSSSNDTFRIQNALTSDMIFVTGGNEFMRARSTGHVLVSATDFYSGSTGRFTMCYAGGGAEYGITMNSVNTTDSTTAIQFLRGGAVAGGSGFTVVGAITHSGSTTNYGTGSDVRAKTNIIPLKETNYEDVIDNIEVFEFEYKASPGMRVPGFLAQKLINQVPTAVDKGDDHPTEIEKMWTVDQAKVVPHVTLGVQNLRARTKELEHQVQTLEQENQVFREELNTLKELVQQLLKK